MLTNEQLSGKIYVVVKNKKLGGADFIETKKGLIVKVLQGDRQGVHAVVDINGDRVERWIFASDQPGDENYHAPVNEIN